MKKSVKRIVSFVSAIAMLSTTAMAVSAAEAITVGEANSICVSGATDFTNVKADVFVIKSATDKLERAALNILKEQFGTKTADKNAIINAASKMSEKELKAAVESTTKAVEASKELQAAITEAEEDIKVAVEKAKAANANAEIVVSTAYNPFATLASSPLVDAAKAAVDVYVKNMNTKIETIAAENKIKVAKIEAPVVEFSKEDVAGSLSNAVAAQSVAKNEAIAKVEVVAEKAPEVAMYGDFNGDRDIRAVDLVIMIQANLGMLDKAKFEEKGYDWNAGDLDRDGESFGLTDIMMLKKVLLEDMAASELGKF